MGSGLEITAVELELEPESGLGLAAVELELVPESGRGLMAVEPDRKLVSGLLLPELAPVLSLDLESGADDGGASEDERA